MMPGLVGLGVWEDGNTVVRAPEVVVEFAEGTLEMM
jgi:hypothetical protein